MDYGFTVIFLSAPWKIKSKEYSDRNKNNAAYDTFLSKYQEKYLGMCRKNINTLLVPYSLLFVFSFAFSNPSEFERRRANMVYHCHPSHPSRVKVWNTNDRFIEEYD